MPSSRILLVEDEDHKVSHLKRQIQASAHKDADLHVAKSVKDAIAAVLSKTYDLVVLDMALPTFTKEKSSGETGGVAQASGGVEVIRMMQQIEKNPPIIVVTQYPDIFISGQLIRLRKIRDTLNRKYKSNVLGVVLYSYEGEDWTRSFDRFLERVV